MTFAAVAIVGGAVAIAGGQLPVAIVFPGVLAVTALGAAGAAVLWAVRDPAVRARLTAWVTPPNDRERPAAGRVASLRRRVASLRRRAAAAIGDLDHRAPTTTLGLAIRWSGLALVLEVTTLWTVFAVAGAPLSAGMLAAGYLSASALNAAPELTPGWIGVYEVTVAATYTALGVPAETAIVAVLLHRLIAFWAPVAVGIVPAVRSLAAGRRADAEAATADAAATPERRASDPPSPPVGADLEVAA